MSLTKQQIGIVVLAVAVSYYASSAFASDNFNKFKSNTAVKEAQITQPAIENTSNVRREDIRPAQTRIKRVVEPIGSGMVIGSTDDAEHFGSRHNKMVTLYQDKSQGMPVVFVPVIPELPRD